LDRLVDLGALDVERLPDGSIAALLPDGATPEHAAEMIGAASFSTSPATSRDDGSVWILAPRATRVGRVAIAPGGVGAGPDAIRLIDSPVFGSGLHPTTALCLEMLDEMIGDDPPGSLLDVGTGSGVLALAALRLGVSRATAIDIDDDALRVAGENARLNGLAARLDLAHGGPDGLDGAWPLVVANVQAAPLIEMAPVLARRVGHYGRLILSGIPRSAAGEVAGAYRHLGMRHAETRSRSDWSALLMHATW
jgi:ribosomal protein L11 methyltransferase